MADKNENVKGWKWCKGRCADLIGWIDSQPRLGWYIALLSTLNTLLLLVK